MDLTLFFVLGFVSACDQGGSITVHTVYPHPLEFLTLFSDRRRPPHGEEANGFRDRCCPTAPAKGF